MLSRINYGDHVFGSTCCDSSKLNFLLSDSKFPSARIYAWFVFFSMLQVLFCMSLLLLAITIFHWGENKMYYKH